MYENYTNFTQNNNIDNVIIVLIVLISISSLYILFYNRKNYGTNSEINNLQNELNSLKKIVNTQNEENEKPTINVNTIDNNTSNPIPPIPPIDPIVNYDRLKLTDPFIDPSQRTSLDQIPAPYFAPYINFPTRGIVDKYHRVGLLIYEHNKEYIKYNEYNENINPIVESSDVSLVTNQVDNKIHDNLVQSNNVKNDNYKKNKPNVPYSVRIEKFGNIQGNDVLELIGMKLYQNTYKYFTSFSEGNKIIKITINTRNNKELYDGDIVFVPELKRKYRVKMDQIDGALYNPYFF